MFGISLPWHDNLLHVGTVSEFLDKLTNLKQEMLQYVTNAPE